MCMANYISKNIYSVTDDIPLKGDVKKYNLVLFAPEEGFKKGDKIAVFDLDEVNKIEEESDKLNNEIDSLNNMIDKFESENIDMDKFNELVNISENKDVEINKLNSSIEKLNEKIENLERENSKLRETVSRLDQDVQEEYLPQTNSQRELYKLQNKVNERNELLFKVAENINQTMEEVILDTVEETKDLINANNQTTKSKISNAVSKTEREVTERNRAVASNINNMVDEVNEELRNVSFWKLLFNRKDIDIRIPTSDLNKQVKINMPNDVVEDKELNVDVLKIKNNHKIEGFDKLWIETDDESVKEPIDVEQVKKEEN